jgi:uncharacterized protein (TIGR02246 family)
MYPESICQSQKKGANVQGTHNRPVAKAEMLIRRPVAEVFEAFVNPAITSRFWFSKGNGRLEVGKEIAWDWEMYDFSVLVTVKAVEENARIVVEWSAYGVPTPIEWIFTARPDGTTFVSVANEGFPGSEADAMQQALDATEGFAFVLAGAKAFLEHNVQLNLVPDRFPDGLQSKPPAPADDRGEKPPRTTAGVENPDDWPRVFENHLNAGDLDAVLALYDSEAHFVAPSGEILVGHDQIREVLARLIAAKTRFRSRVIRAVTVGEIAHLSTDFEGTMVDESGKTVAIRSKAIEVLRRQRDGGWKLIVGNPNGRE